MKTGKCEFCNKALIVLPTSNGSVLPVEVQSGRIYTDDDVYDAKKDRSHLLSCKPQAQGWQLKKKKYIKAILPNISPKQLHR